MRSVTSLRVKRPAYLCVRKNTLKPFWAARTKWPSSPKSSTLYAARKSFHPGSNETCEVNTGRFEPRCAQSTKPAITAAAISGLLRKTREARTRPGPAACISRPFSSEALDWPHHGAHHLAVRVVVLVLGLADTGEHRGLRPA